MEGFGGFLEGLWRIFGGSLEGFWRVFGRSFGVGFFGVFLFEKVSLNKSKFWEGFRPYIRSNERWHLQVNSLKLNSDHILQIL